MKYDEVLFQEVYSKLDRAKNQPTRAFPVNCGDGYADTYESAVDFYNQNYQSWLGTLDIHSKWFAIVECAPTHQYAVRATFAEAEALGRDYFGSDPYVIFRIP